MVMYLKWRWFEEDSYEILLYYDCKHNVIINSNSVLVMSSAHYLVLVVLLYFLNSELVCVSIEKRRTFFVLLF